MNENIEDVINDDVRNDDGYGDTQSIEDDVGVKRFVAENQGKKRFKHLVEDINFAILDERDKMIVSELLRLRKLMLVVEETPEDSTKDDTFGSDLEHDVLAISHVSSAYKGRKLDKMLSRTSSKSYEVIEHEQKKRRYGAGRR